jgi:LysM repeat protein
MPKDTFIQTGKKNQPFPSYGKEPKSSLFWVIFVLVCLITIAIIYFVVSSSTVSTAPSPMEEHKNPLATPPPEPPPLAKIARPKPLQGKKIPANLNEKLKTVENLMVSGNLIQAKQLLLETLDDVPEENHLSQKLEQLLGEINMEVFKSDISCPEKKIYTIQKGDTLINIAEEMKTTVEAIQTTNKLDLVSHIIFPGKTLSIYSADWKIKISKSKKRLYIIGGDKIFKSYAVEIGDPNKTPSGEFEVSTKQKDPVWHSSGKAIPAGDPKNILGTRWIGLSRKTPAEKSVKGFGIHGGLEQGKTGSDATSSCIIMNNEDINELYMIIPQKTTFIAEE